MADETRRVRTQAERAADDHAWRATAATRPGFATYPDSQPGSPFWWARHGDQPPTRRPAVAPECSTSHPQLHADCDGCTCPCHRPAPRRRWWHRYTRRTR